MPKKDASAAPIGLFGIQGRWGVNAPLACPPEQCIEAENVDFFRTTLARKRSGAVNVSLTGGTAQTGAITFLFSHVPGFDQTLRELWAWDTVGNSSTGKRLAGGTAWADVTVVDSPFGGTVGMNACSFNGKLHFFYNSNGVNRSHCWDPADAKVRRTGLALPAAPTAADTGVGAISGSRSYRVAYAVMSGTTILRRSNLSPILTFTPSGSGSAIRLTKPASISESETHWLIYGSTTAANFGLVATVAVGTTTYDDTTASVYTGTAAPDPNAFTPPPSARFAVADGGQMVMAGAWETSAGSAMAPSARRAWWTSPLGATDQGDDERISNTSVIKSYTDFDAAITGLSSPQQGSIYVFSYNAMWKLVSTGVPTAPYTWYRITGAKGCIEHKTIVSAVDEGGSPCTYWMSPQGPCRLGVGGQFTMVEDINDLWDTVNLNASTIVGHGLYHRDKHQIWWWLASGASSAPDLKVVFDTDLGRVTEAGKVRRGWVKHTGASSAAYTSTMMSNTLGASMSLDLKPYIGLITGTKIWKCDTGTDDAGTDFKSYILSRPLTPAGLGVDFGIVNEAWLAAAAAAGVTITVTTIRDYGQESLTSSALLTASAAGESRVSKRVEDIRLAGAKVAQFQVGDSAAASNAWVLDAMVFPVTGMGANG